MSRAYRISVKESVTRDIKGSDEISTQIELLEILPPEAMAELLKKELEARGFQENDDGTLVRKDGDVTVSVDPCNGEVSVKAGKDKTVTEQATREGWTYDDVGPSAKSAKGALSEQLKKELEQKIAKEQEKLQKEASEKLEKELNDIQPELSEIVNKVTKEALKTKAAQMGTITEIAEDEKSGSMTIKVEV
jgi:DNA polymerase III gamma/tau subunit